MVKISRNDVQVVIVASPGMGHTIPSLELAKCLVSNHGVHITFFAPTTTADQSQLDLLNHTPSSLPRNLHIINVPPVDISNSVSPDTDAVTRISTVVRESLPTIRSIIEKLPQRPTVMITDLLATDAFQVADALNMVKYLFFTSNVTALAIMANYYPKMLELDRDDQDRADDELIRVPGCKTYRLKDIGGVGSFLDRTSGAFERTTNHERFVKVSGVLVNTFEDLEKHTTNNLINDDEILRQIPLPHVYPVGPMIRSSSSSSSSSSSDGTRSDCLIWLDTQPCDSVLFVSFGSSGTLSAEQLTELAWGLELSQQRFIWVVRKPILYMVGNESSDPSEYLPDGFLNRVRGRGLVVPDWAPQIEILSHVAVGGFLSHCGWNSTLESIVHGVPMIPWPLYAEQHLNALVVCGDLKVAVGSPIRSGNGIVVVRRREDIEKAVRLLMEGQEGKVLRCRAKVFQTSAAEAVNEGGSSYNALSRVVEKWMEES